MYVHMYMYIHRPPDGEECSGRERGECDCGECTCYIQEELLRTVRKYHNCFSPEIIDVFTAAQASVYGSD